MIISRLWCTECDLWFGVFIIHVVLFLSLHIPTNNDLLLFCAHFWDYACLHPTCFSLTWRIQPGSLHLFMRAPFKIHYSPEEKEGLPLKWGMQQAYGASVPHTSHTFHSTMAPLQPPPEISWLLIRRYSSSYYYNTSMRNTLSISTTLVYKYKYLANSLDCKKLGIISNCNYSIAKERETGNLNLSGIANNFL